MQATMIVKKTLHMKDSFVAFLDVLGFKELVMRKDKATADRVGVYFGVVDEIRRELKVISGKAELSMVSISDSIVMCMPTGGVGDRIDRLRHLCAAIAKAQIRLAEQDIWIRGGVSVGEIHASETENLVVGPALVRAYLLEEKQAKFPRVVLDNALVEHLGAKSSDELIGLINDHEFNDWKTDLIFRWSGRWLENVSFDRDLPFFIDYLSSFTNGSQGNIQKRLIRNLTKNILTCSLEQYPKYDWVRRYIMAQLDAPNDDQETGASELFQTLRAL